MKNLKISIITINLNNRQGLAHTLESIAQQTFNNYEHIIIDGDSTDGSQDIIREYCARNPHITYWISEKDKGIYNAMNKGILQAKGEYLLFLNSGDTLVDNVLQLTAPLLNATDLIYGNLYFVSESGAKRLEVYPEPPFKATDLLAPSFYLPHPATFIRKDLFENQLYSEQYKIVSDWEFWIKCILFKDSSLKHIDITISSFMEGGLSANFKRANQEKEEVLKNLLPQKVIEDLYELLSIRKSPLYEGFKLTKHAGHFQKRMNKLIKFCYKIRCKLTKHK